MDILHTTIEEGNVSLQYVAHTWKYAIYEGCRILEDKNHIHSKFYHDIIDATEKYGAYYIITPHVAIPHVSDESNILSNSMSIVILKEYVIFPKKDKKVDILFTLAFQKNFIDTHNITEQLISIFEDKLFPSRLRKCSTQKELLSAYEEREK